MNTQRKIVILLLMSPLILPLLFCFIVGTFLISDISSSIVNIHYEYSLSLAPSDLKKLAQDTIKIEGAPILAMSASSQKDWIFMVNAPGEEMTSKQVMMHVDLKSGSLRVEKSERYIKQILTQTSPPPVAELSRQPVAEPISTNENPLKKHNNSVQNVSHPSHVDVNHPPHDDNDPFISEWKLAKAPTQSPKGPSPSSNAGDVKDNPSQTHLLSTDLADQKYYHYVSIDGKVQSPLSTDDYFVEVSFYDQLGLDGLDTEESTVLASQEIKDGGSLFSLRLPSETQGYLMAKLFSLQDIKKENPLYIGAFSKNPMTIPKEGIQNVTLALMSRTKYVDKYQTILSGRVLNEYGSSGSLDRGQGISDVIVWVAEHSKPVATDEKGFFEIKGLGINREYHLIFEKEGFASIQVPVKLLSKKMEQSFVLSPETKFSRGYDSMLGPRDPDKATVFATVKKQGKPLEHAIVKAAQSQKVVYERMTDLVSFPDPSLYSASENGNVIVWNAKPGKNKIDIYYDGELLGSRMVSLSPGMIHQFVFEF